MNRMLLVSLFVAACGDGTKPNTMPDGSTVDAPAAAPHAVVVAGDFATPGFSGVMSSLDVTSMTMTQNVAPAGAIGNDPVLRKIGGELFIVNRFMGNNVTILDAATFAVKDQLSTGASSNPQDVATFANKLFVPAMGTKGVVVLERGSTTITTIDLTALDADGFPDCVSAYRAGNDIYVACELLDQNFAPRGPGKVAVIDALNLTVRATVTMSTANPFGAFTELPNNEGIAIPTYEFGNATSRCLEQIQVAAAPFSKGCLVNNADVGGYIVRAVTQKVGDSEMLWMVVDDGAFPNAKARVWGFDLVTKQLWDAPLTPEAQLLGDIAACPNGQFVVADKTKTKNGLRVYEGGVEKTTEPLAVGLNPQSTPSLVCY